MKKRHWLIMFVLPILLLMATAGLWLWQAKQQYALNRQLIAALEQRDAKTALVLIKRGANPNTQTISPRSPSLKLLFGQLLHHTPPSVNNSPTAFMLACGILRNAPVGSSTPLIDFDENLPLLQAMLAHGANVHAIMEGNRTSLHDAVWTERWNTVALLLQHGADVNAKDTGGTTPLMLSTANQTVSIAHLLLSHGATPNVQDVYGQTALYAAIENITLDEAIPKRIISELLMYGADPNLQDNDGTSPLMLAKQAKRPDIVSLLRRGRK